MAGHKWWRLTNITKLKMYEWFYHVISEIKFVTTDNQISSNTTRAFSNNYQRNYPPSKAFDNKNNTFWASQVNGTLDDMLSTYIGYQFDEPVELQSVQVQCRQDMQPEQGFEIQTADVEYSDDGTNWIKYGKIIPFIEQMDLSMHTVDIIPLHLNNAYTIDLSLTQHPPKNQGYIAGEGEGIVTERGRPAKREIWVMPADGYAFCRRQWSLPSGHYLVTGLDPNKRYLIMARDLPPAAGAEAMPPAGHDYVEPETDLTIAEQQALWQSWQT